jgi:hypothetical protein
MMQVVGSAFPGNLNEKIEPEMIDALIKEKL